VYKLIYKRQFAAGFDADQVVGNLAQLLHLKPKTVRLVFLSERPSVIKLVQTDDDVKAWCAAFLEAGVHLDVISLAAADANDIADQIELELELHQLDDDDLDDEPQLFVRREIAREVGTEILAADEVVAASVAPELPVPVLSAVVVAQQELSIESIEAVVVTEVVGGIEEGSK
jgi:hypothetical protein